MAGFDTREMNELGEYEIRFYTKDKREYVAVQEFCRKIVVAKQPLKCDTCKHEKARWFSRCADCSDYELWEPADNKMEKKMTIEKAIDLLDTLVGMITDNQDSDYDDALKMGIEALKATACNNLATDLQPSKQDDLISRQAEPHWIPCRERLPEENRTVIASTEYGVYPEARYTKEDGWEWAYEFGADYWVELDEDEVKAWQPLPEPYREGE